MKKVYVIRKYIAAHSALDAMRKDHKTEISEIFIDDSWLRDNAPNLNRMMKLPIKATDDDYLEEIE